LSVKVNERLCIFGGSIGHVCVGGMSPGCLGTDTPAATLALVLWYSSADVQLANVSQLFFSLLLCISQHFKDQLLLYYNNNNNNINVSISMVQNKRP